MDFETARMNMVDSQIRPNDVTDPHIVGAFLRTPRELFVPTSKRSLAYSEFEIETAPGRALWTARDTAKLIKLAAIKPTDIVLVIGAGAGYEAALISRFSETVIALEETARETEAMTQRFADLELDRAVAVQGPLAQGLADQAPFDVIYVCGMVEIVPDAWLAQLNEGGRLAAVVLEAGKLGRGRVYTKSGNAVSARDGFDAAPPKFTAFNRKSAFVF